MPNCATIVKMLSSPWRASSTNWPFATCTTWFGPVPLVWPLNTLCKPCLRSSACFLPSGSSRLSDLPPPASLPGAAAFCAMAKGPANVAITATREINMRFTATLLGRCIEAPVRRRPVDGKVAVTTLPSFVQSKSCDRCNAIGRSPSAVDSPAPRTRGVLIANGAASGRRLPSLGRRAALPANCSRCTCCPAAAAPSAC